MSISEAICSHRAAICQSYWQSVVTGRPCVNLIGNLLSQGGHMSILLAICCHRAAMCNLSGNLFSHGGHMSISVAICCHRAAMWQFLRQSVVTGRPCGSLSNELK